jgi:hypothetical protein
MTLHIIGIDQDPDSAQPSPQSLLRAAKACSVTAGSKSQLLQKLDALKSILPVQKTGTHDGLPFKLLDSIRDDAERLTRGDSLTDQFWANAEKPLNRYCERPILYRPSSPRCNRSWWRHRDRCP